MSKPKCLKAFFSLPSGPVTVITLALTSTVTEYIHILLLKPKDKISALYSSIRVTSFRDFKDSCGVDGPHDMLTLLVLSSTKIIRIFDRQNESLCTSWQFFLKFLNLFDFEI